MYKLVIVDDEPTEIKFIRYVIETFKLPFYICGEGENGEQAVELVKKHSPEFVIMDIHMPLMDGLTAANMIKRDRPQTKVYLLTAYELFEYAQKAVKADVDEYLLKPIKPELLANVLKEGISEALKQRLSEREMDKTKRIIKKMKPLLKRQLIFELVSIGLTKENAANVRKVLGLQRVDVKGVLVITIGDDRGQLLMEAGFREELVKRIEEQNGFGVSEILPSGDIVCFLKEWNGRVEHDLGVTLETYSHDYKTTIYAGFSSVNAQGHIPAAFASGDKIRKTALFWRVPGIFLNSQLGPIQDHLPDILSMEKIIFNLLLARNIDKIHQVIKELFRVACERLVSPEQGIALANRIVNSTMTALAEQLIPEGEAVIIAQQYLEKISSVKSYEELENLLFELFNNIEQRLDVKNETQTEQSIKWAALYIRQNYQQDISLDQLANKLFLSPSYFSRMFKKHIGESFASFLIKVRMEHAQTLLTTGKFSVTQVAKKVGYDNSGYFSTVYKKHFGISPNQAMMHHGERV